MQTRRNVITLIAAAGMLACLAACARGGTAGAAAKLPVVATFSILADLARNVGGDRIEVISLVGPDGDAHVYQPTPEDAKNLNAAKLILVNGLGLEGWFDRLIKASGAQGADHRRDERHRAAQDGGGRQDRHRSARLAVDPQRRDLCRQYPRRA